MQCNSKKKSVVKFFRRSPGHLLQIPCQLFLQKIDKNFVIQLKKSSGNKIRVCIKSESAKVLQTLQSGLFEIKNQSHWAYKISLVFEQFIGMPKKPIQIMEEWKQSFEELTVGEIRSRCTGRRSWCIGRSRRIERHITMLITMCAAHIRVVAHWVVHPAYRANKQFCHCLRSHFPWVSPTNLAIVIE